MYVLVATDGSREAWAAIRLLRRVAHRSAVDVTVLAVVPRGIQSPEHLPDLLAPVVDRRSIATEAMLRAVEFLNGSGIRARGLIAEGRAGAEIVSAAVYEDSDLVVVGSGSNSVLAHLLGSVSTHVLNHSPCSVMVVHSLASDLKPRRLLVATDGGPQWGAELHLLERLIDPRRTELKVVSVAATDPPQVMVSPGAHAPLMDDHERERLRKRAERAVDLACDQLSERGFSVSSAVASGPVALTLEDLTKEWSAALTVVGSRGLHGAERIMLGSVGQTLARRAPATLVVREEQGASITIDDQRELEHSSR